MLDVSSLLVVEPLYIWGRVGGFAGVHKMCQSTDVLHHLETVAVKVDSYRPESATWRNFDQCEDFSNGRRRGWTEG
jgi:D-alanyl-D-alanine dipeptidase